MKKLLAMVLLVGLLCSTAACGTNTASDSSEGTSESAAVSETGSESDEPITITIGIDRGADIVYPEGDSQENNAWTRAYEDAGIKIEYKMVASGDQYNQKVALGIASRDLPDIWKSNKTNFYTAVENGYAYDLTGMKEKYLSDLSKQYTEEYTIPFEAVMVDGKEYAWPELNEDPTAGASFLFLRHDWLEALGREVPTTQDELIDTLIAFAKEDPDGNGKDDTYGLAVKKELWETNHVLEGFFNSYHAYPNIWYEQDGELVYGTVQAEPMKAALTDLQKLYEAGAIDPEFIVKDSTKVDEDITALKLGATYSRWWIAGGSMANSYIADPEKVSGRWWCVETPSADGEPVKLQSSSSAPNNFFVVNANTEHPEAIYTLINVWFENMFSPDLTEEQYRTYAVAEDHLPQGFALITPWPYINPRLDYIQAVLDGTMEEDELTGESAAKYSDLQDFINGSQTRDGYDAYWNYNLADPHSSSSVRIKYEDSTISNMAYGPSTDTMIDKMSTLEKLRDETIVQIITGQKSVDEFDAFVEDWYKLGGEDIVKEMNEWYQTTK
jgi:putative aldouronate transport system substrate-binding protein